jgi:hypothetical protein
MATQTERKIISLEEKTEHTKLHDVEERVENHIFFMKQPGL